MHRAAANLAVSGTGVAFRGTAVFTYTLAVTGNPATGVVLRTAQDARLPATDAAAASVRLDRKALPPGRVTRVGGDLVVTVGDLAVGRHSLTFSLDVPAAVRGRTTSSATATPAGDTASSSGPVDLTVNQADLRVRGSSDNAGATLGNGRVTEVMVDMDNVGSVNTAAYFDVTLSAGLRLGPGGINRVTEDSLVPLSCTRTATGARCQLGELATGERPLTVAVDLTTATGARPGQAGVTITLEPTPDPGIEADPADNTVNIPVELVGEARLQATITPATATLRPGQRELFTLRLTNLGPQPTTGIFAAAELDQTGLQAAIVSFTGPGADGAPTSAAASGTARRAGAARIGAHRGPSGSATPADLPVYDVHYWIPNEIPAGGAVVAHLLLQAKRTGVAEIRLTGSSLAGDPHCPSAFDNCLLAASTVHIQVPPRSPAGSGSQLANTGTPAGRLALIGGLLLVAGAAATAFARPRRS